MSDLFASGSLIDIILCFVVLEAILVAWWLKGTRRGIGFSSIAGNLAAGFCLLATVRLAIAGAWWGWMALALAASLIAHLFDLWSRFSSANAGMPGKSENASPARPWPARSWPARFWPAPAKSQSAGR